MLPFHWRLTFVLLKRSLGNPNWGANGLASLLELVDASQAGLRVLHAGCASHDHASVVFNIAPSDECLLCVYHVCMFVVLSQPRTWQAVCGLSVPAWRSLLQALKRAPCAPLEVRGLPHDFPPPRYAFPRYVIVPVSSPFDTGHADSESAVADATTKPISHGRHGRRGGRRGGRSMGRHGSGGSRGGGTSGGCDAGGGGAGGRRAGGDDGNPGGGSGGSGNGSGGCGGGQGGGGDDNRRDDDDMSSGTSSDESSSSISSSSDGNPTADRNVRAPAEGNPCHAQVYDAQCRAVQNARHIEDVLRTRECAVHQREGAVHQREGAIAQREAAVAQREEFVHGEEQRVRLQRCSVEQAKRDAEEAKRNAEEAKHDAEEAKRDAEEAVDAQYEAQSRIAELTSENERLRMQLRDARAISERARRAAEEAEAAHMRAMWHAQRLSPPEAKGWAISWHRFIATLPTPWQSPQQEQRPQGWFSRVGSFLSLTPQKRPESDTRFVMRVVTGAWVTLFISCS